MITICPSAKMAIREDKQKLKLIEDRIILQTKIYKDSKDNLNNTIKKLDYRDPILPKIYNSESGFAVHEYMKKETSRSRKASRK